MRLLNVRTLNFEEFIGEVGDGIPSYAILSHTWGTEEVSYSDHINKNSSSKKGYDKIHGCCRLADSEGFQYVWIDTCCIEKSSSAELSEAINSMFQWYRDAGICYAYLSDVNSSEDPSREESSFARSNWFKRGWTLQELLAPSEVVFLGSDWVEIGTKKSLRAIVSRVTRVSQKVLDECHWTEYSIAQKMSWAAGRSTTRLEDEAYCLMGLFDVNMPLLYGEGRKAFLRLQQEILKHSDDQSIFAWSYSEEEQGHTQYSGLLAPSVEFFREGFRIELQQDHGDGDENPFEIVNRLVRIRLRLVDNIREMRFQRVLRRPALYRIVEVRQGQGASNEEHSTLSLPSVLPRDELFKDAAPIVQVTQQLPMPIITIDPADTTTVEGSRISSGFTSQTTGETGVDSGLRRTTMAVDESEGVFDLSPESSGIIGPESWRSYIYEPVIIVPLRCRIGDHQLGILLSRGSIETKGRVLSRLHNLSFVTTNAIREYRPMPLTSIYASIFIRSNNTLSEP